MGSDPGLLHFLVLQSTPYQLVLFSKYFTLAFSLSLTTKAIEQCFFVLSSFKLEALRVVGYWDSLLPVQYILSMRK